MSSPERTVARAFLVMTASASAVQYRTSSEARTGYDALVEADWKWEPHVEMDQATKVDCAFCWDSRHAHGGAAYGQSA